MLDFDPKTMRMLSALATVALPRGPAELRTYQKAIRELRDQAADPDTFEQKLLLARLPEIGATIKSRWIMEGRGTSILRDEGLHLESIAVTSLVWARAMGLPRGEYAVLFVHDAAGGRHTLVGEDPDYIHLMKSAPLSALADLKIPPEKFPLRREGWPSEWE